MEYPNVLVIAGHDPSGGAGLQADIEAIAAQRAHAATVPTLLTCQDTRDVYDVLPVATAFVQDCIDRLVADMRFAAIKVGVVANTEQVRIIHATAQRLAPIPVVVDPVLKAAGGGQLADEPVARALVDLLFQRAAVITPNAAEARRLCHGQPDLVECGRRLAKRARHVLITGGDEPDEAVINTLYSDGETQRRWRWPRLPGRYHGSGCTLAATLAARLAHRDSPAAAIETAQRITWQALEAGTAAGSGQTVPRRLQGFWSNPA